MYLLTPVIALTDSKGAWTVIANGDTAGSSAVSLLYDGLDTVRLDARTSEGGGGLKLKHAQADLTLANLFTTVAGGQLDLHNGQPLSPPTVVLEGSTGDGIFNGQIVANDASFTAVSQLLAGSNVGDMFYHGPTGVERLAPGAAGQVLTSQGPGLPPVWTNANQGAAQIQTGSYDGDNVTCRTIPVGFAPDTVVIINSGQNFSFIILENFNQFHNGSRQDTFPTCGELLATGFTVGMHPDSANASGSTYAWIAFKTTD